MFFKRESEISSFNSDTNNMNQNNIQEAQVLNIPLGDKYEGEIKNNKPNGKGIYYSITGDIKEGEFKDGRLNGQGKITLSIISISA